MTKLSALNLNKMTWGFMDDPKPRALIEKNVEKKELEKLNLNDIIQVDFPDDQYYRSIYNKKQIVLHHTVSGEGVNGDINWWRQTASRIGTSLIIDDKGKMYQCFSTKYWGYHLGVKGTNGILDKHSIGIEIDSWGGLVKKGKYWYPAKWDSKENKYIGNTNYKPINDVVIYENGFRGFYGFQKYTDEQILSVQKLLVYLNEKYEIPILYNPNMWDINKDALNGIEGLWSHVSFRKDKSDCHPQKELIDMLKGLR